MPFHLIHLTPTLQGHMVIAGGATGSGEAVPH